MSRCKTVLCHNCENGSHVEVSADYMVMFHNIGRELPLCSDCYDVALQDADEINNHEMDHFDGAFGLVFLTGAPIDGGVTYVED